MFNAIKYSQELEKAGFSREQAEASVRLLIDVMDQNLASKDDLQKVEIALRSDMKTLENSLRSDMKALENSLRSDMKEFENSLRSDMKEIEYKLTTRLGTLMTVLIGLAVAIIKIH